MQRLTNIRAGAARAVGTPGPEGSIGKLAMAELNKEISEFAVDLMGADGMLFAGGYPMTRPRGTALWTSPHPEALPAVAGQLHRGRHHRDHEEHPGRAGARPAGRRPRRQGPALEPGAAFLTAGRRAPFRVRERPVESRPEGGRRCPGARLPFGAASRPPGSATMRRTKIVATIGPASDPPEVLAALLDAGMDVVRLGLAHGEPEEHLERYRAHPRDRQPAGPQGRRSSPTCPAPRCGRARSPRAGPSCARTRQRVSWSPARRPATRSASSSTTSEPLRLRDQRRHDRRWATAR